MDASYLWTAEYTLEDEEIQKAVEYYIVKSRQGKRIVHSVLLTVLTIGFLVTFFLSEQASGVLVLFFISLAALLAVILEPVLLAKKTIQEATEQKKPSALKGTEDGIAFKSGEELVPFSWKEILVCKQDDSFLLRLPTGLLVIVPVRVLDDVAQKDLQEHSVEEIEFRKVIRR